MKKNKTTTWIRGLQELLSLSATKDAHLMMFMEELRRFLEIPFRTNYTDCQELLQLKHYKPLNKYYISDEFRVAMSSYDI